MVKRRTTMIRSTRCTTIADVSTASFTAVCWPALTVVVSHRIVVEATYKCINRRWQNNADLSENLSIQSDAIELFTKLLSEHVK